jgi:hypothetical protein
MRPDTAHWVVDHDPLRVVPLPAVDPIAGHDPCGMYVETFWLPVVGPTTIVLLRRLGAWLSAEPAGLSLDLSELSKMIGLGEYRSGPTAGVVRALARMASFDLARPVDRPGVFGGEFQLILPVPSLLDRQVRRLPPSLRSTHEYLERMSP